MMRYTLLIAFLGILGVTAVFRWYWALCGLVMLTALTQHPDFPSNLGGVQGANPWNALFVVILLSWLFQRRHEERGAAAPSWPTVGLVAYVGMVISAGGIALMDAPSPREYLPSAAQITNDAIINPLKYTCIAVLFCDGARTRNRIKAALFCAVGSGLLYALMLFKSIGSRIFTIDYIDARRLTDKLVGLFANDLGQLLAFTLWAALCLVWLLRSRLGQVGWLLLVASAVPPFVALKSRAGFLSFCCAGLTLGILRWRVMLVWLCVAIALGVVAAPSVRERVMTGVGQGSNASNDWNEISSGRVTGIWPPVIRQIEESPVWGHGRYALLREDCYFEVKATERIVPTHPHNAYLEILLDAGIVGLGICLAWMLMFGRAGAWLLRQRADPLLSSLGAAVVSGLAVFLSAGLAGGSFFPSQSNVPYLCVWGIGLGVYSRRNAPAVTSGREPTGVPWYDRKAAGQWHRALG